MRATVTPSLRPGWFGPAERRARQPPMLLPSLLGGLGASPRSFEAQALHDTTLRVSVCVCVFKYTSAYFLSTGFWVPAICLLLPTRGLA